MARNTVIQGAGSALGRLLMLVFYLVMARQLGTEGFGDFNFAMAVGVVIVIAGLGTDYAVTRMVAHDRDSVQTVFWNALAVRVASGGVATLIAIAIAVVSGQSAELVLVVGLVSCAFWLDLLAGSLAAVFRGLEQTGPIAMSWIVERSVVATLGSAALLGGAGLVAAAGIFLLGAVAGLAYIWWRLWAAGVRPRFRVTRGIVWQLARDSLPLSLGVTMIWLLARMDILILSAIQGNAEVGIYSAGYRLFESTLFLARFLGLSAYPALSRLGRDTTPRLGDAVEKGMLVVGLLMATVGVTFVLSAEPIVETLYGRSFDEAVFVVRMLGLAAPLWGTLVLLMYVLAAQDRQWTITKALGIGVAINVGLNLALVPGLGAHGAAIAMPASLAVIAVGLTVPVVRLGGAPRWMRVLWAPSAGVAGAVVAQLVTGPTLAGIVIGVVCFWLFAAIAERALFPDDLTVLLRTLRRLRPTPVGGAP